jgi:hypothetical protein
MGLRVGRRDCSAASRVMAVMASLVAVLGQFFALHHEISIQHVRCAEHGELTDVAAAHGWSAGSAADLSVLRNEEAQAAGGHDHCSTACVLKTGAKSPVTRISFLLVAPLVRLLPAGVVPAGNRALLLAAAPKTSPPSA